MSSKKKKNKEPKKLKKSKKEDLAPEPAKSFAISELLGVKDSREALKIDSLMSRLSDITTYKDIGHTSYIYNELYKAVDPYLKSGAWDQVSKDYSWSLIGVNDIFGYRAFSSQFSGLFGSPFGCFTYLAENHSAVLDCRQILTREVLADGYRLVGGTKQERQKAKEICTQLNMKRLRCQIVDHLKTFGNVFFEPIRNGMKGIKEIKPLLPNFIRPIPTVDGQNIKEWWVQKGAYYRIYSRDALLTAQLRPCLKNYDIGNPPLGAALVNLEADLCSQSFNNTLFQRGGLMGIAVLLEGAQGGGNSRGKGPSAYAQYLQANLQANHSGSRAGFETVVFENAKDVKVLNKLSELDGAFGRSADSTKKEVAHVYGIPHEMLGVITNSNQQYHPSSMMDYSAKQLDKTIAEVLDTADTFINKKIFPLVGIKNVRIKASPRYNATTRVATQAGTDLGSLYNVISVDEYRTEWLGRPPLPNGEGRMALSKLVLDGGTKGGEGGAGAKPQQVIVPPEMPPIEMDSEESDLGAGEGEPG